MSTQIFDSSEYFDIIADCAKKFRDSDDYQRTLDILQQCLLQGGTVFTMGCGGSASTASHFAADLAKTTINHFRYHPRFKVMSLVDNVPLVSAWTNDEGWGSVFSGQLEPWLTDKDVLIGFSVHGGSGSGSAGPWSQNLVNAMRLAQQRHSKIIGFAGFDGGAMKKMADVCLIVPSDSEVYGTPVVEAFHVVLQHGLIFDLKERISGDTKK